MNHVHGSIPIHVHLVLTPGPDGLQATLLQTSDAARFLAAEPGARAYSLDCTLLDLLENRRLRWTPLEPMETTNTQAPARNPRHSRQDDRWQRFGT